MHETCVESECGKVITEACHFLKYQTYKVLDVDAMLNF